jgi:hypothetical protein
VLKSRKLVVALGTVLAVLGLAVIPVAEADTCVVTVTTITGQKLTFTVNVPPGTPLSSISLPVKVAIASESETCTASPTTTSSSSTTTSSSRTSSSTSSRSSRSSSSTSTTRSRTQTTPHTTGPGNPEQQSSHPGGGTTSTSSTSTPSNSSSNPPPTTTKGGVPTPANPTFSFSLPGPAAIGVPNFFIDSFQIPPFLLPIYQAAGIQYDVPWQVLAAINEIETDYGRNLSVSSAGAVGWMQFEPSTWKTYGMDVTHSGYADPYNPVDAIFAAARYLHAAGASKSISNAIYSYNHAGWYVQSVLLRAQLIGGMPSGLIGALTGLVEGHFPVAAAATYADDDVAKMAGKKVKGGDPAEAVASDPASTGVKIFAKQN